VASTIVSGAIENWLKSSSAAPLAWQAASSASGLAALAPQIFTSPSLP
jgi:mevalonate pyrophosphate decarboxylase